MGRYLAAIGLTVGFAWPVWADTGYVYPLPSWHVTTQHGDAIGGGLYHMGVDAGFDTSAGTPVYATGDGIIREAQERTQFGLVVLIEHDAGTADAHVSLYGHLDPSDVRVTVGQIVAAGDVIGVLGNETNNGGWSVHLHFGIHKSPYTGDWVYYGHVYDPETATQWYNPEKYIPNHAATDVWQPTVSTTIVDGAVIGNTIPLAATVGDIGGGVQTLKVRLKTAGTAWQTITTYTQPYYEFYDEIDVSEYPDGDIQFKLIVRDGVTEKTTLTRTVTKDPYRYTTPAFVAAKNGPSDFFVSQWSFGGTALNGFFPFGSDWNHGGYLAMADDMIAAIRRDTADSTSVAKLFTASGTLTQKFKLKDIQPVAATLADDVLVVADKRTNTVTAYSTTGVNQWTITPTIVVTDVAVIDSTVYVCGHDSSRPLVLVMDTAGTEIARWRPFGKYLTSPGCHIAVGDVTGDGAVDIIAGSFGKTPGTLAVLSADGTRLQPSMRPFGDSFTGQVDVATLPWDTTEDAIAEAELLVSQASAGQAWVKTYRLSEEPVVLFEQRVYEADFTNGAQVVSSVYAW